MGWAPPEVAKATPWTPPEVVKATGDITTPADDDSPEAAEANAEIAGGDVLGSMIKGAAASTYGGLAMGGKALTNVVGLTSGDPLETGRAATAAASEAMGGTEPVTEGGREAAGALARGMAVPEHAIERAEDYLDPSGNLKATAQDIAERGNLAGAALNAVPVIGGAVGGARAMAAGAAERAAVRGAATEAAAAEAAPLDAARAHLAAKGVPINGQPVAGAPGRTVPATSQQLAQGYNRAVLAHVGETGPNATSPLEALPAARDRITGVMDEIGARTSPQLDTEAAGDLQRIQRSLPGRMSNDTAAPIHHNIETLIDAAAKNDGHVPGPVLQEISTNLRSLEAKPELAETASEMHEALGDLVARHAAPGDVEALATARNQYRALKQVEGAINPVTGDIDPKRLMTQLSAKKNRNQALYGQGDQELMQTARAGARVLPDMHAALADQRAGQLSAADRVRIKLANIAEGAALGWAGPVGGALGEATGAAPMLRGAVVRATGGSREAAAVARGESPLGARVGGGRQRGAVGTLNPPGIVHEHTPETGEHIVRSPNGETHAFDQANGDIKISRTDTADVAQGGGEGTQRMIRLAELAHDRGGRLVSDFSVSHNQQGVYAAMARAGYDVKKNPNAIEKAGRSVSDNINKPVFTVSRRSILGSPQAGGPTRPRLAEMMPGQRGGPKFERGAETARAGGSEPATVNIGLHQGNPGEPGFRKMSKQEAVAALKSQGLNVGKTSVVQSNTEPTFVADIHRPMTAAEADAVAAKTKQQAIVQRDASGNGTMHGPQAEKWGPFNPDYFREHDGRTMTEHAAEFNPEKLEIHPNSTVREPLRSAYPGIYDDPKQIMSRVKTAPEDPIMKELFGKDRKALHDDAVARGDVAPSSVSGVKEGERARGSAAAKNVMTDENAERIRNTIAAFKEHDLSAYHGMVGWYEMGALHDAVQRVLGKGKLADKAYSRLNTFMGMASPGSEVESELSRGTAAHMMASKGEFGKFERYGGNPSTRAAMKNAPELAEVPGHPYHSTAHTIPMRRFVETGEGARAPKTAAYIAASENPKSPAYQNKVLVGDSHFSRGVGLSDVRSAKDFSGSVSGPELGTLHPWYHENVAKPSGLPATSAQAVQWGALSAETGVTTPVGAPKLELFARAVKKAADRLGITPREALERIIKGTAYAG
jgi:hypothetical protein